MKLKWIVVALCKRSKEYHCWQRLFNSKEEAEQETREHRLANKGTPIEGLYIHKKTKIFPINWSSVIARNVKERKSNG